MIDFFESFIPEDDNKVVCVGNNKSGCGIDAGPCRVCERGPVITLATKIIQAIGFARYTGCLERKRPPSRSSISIISVRLGEIGKSSSRFTLFFFLFILPISSKRYTCCGPRIYRWPSKFRILAKEKRTDIDYRVHRRAIIVVHDKREIERPRLITPCARIISLRSQDEQVFSRNTRKERRKARRGPMGAAQCSINVTKNTDESCSRD